jgi:hypothetical protein
VQADIKQDECDTRATLNKANTKLDATLQQWETLTPTTGFRDAMLAPAMYMEFNIAWDTRSDILLARAVAAIGGERLVAHWDAPRFYSNGWWKSIDALPAALVLAIEDAFNRALTCVSTWVQKASSANGTWCSTVLLRMGGRHAGGEVRPEERPLDNHGRVCDRAHTMEGVCC